MKMLKGLVLFNCLLFIGIFPLSSIAQDLPNQLFSGISSNKYEIRGSDGIFVDFASSSIVDTRLDRAERLDFVGDAYAGSFLNSNKKEYLLCVRIAEGQFCSFFSHADNGGNTTFLFIFDDSYNQIGQVGFQDYPSKITEIVDIDNDGIDEIIMESSYGQQGCNWQWWMIFSHDLNTPLLKLTKYQSCEDSGLSGEIMRLKSVYEISKGEFIVNSVLETVYREGNQLDVKLIRSEKRKDVYKYFNGQLIHVEDQDNVKWDESGNPY